MSLFWNTPFVDDWLFRRSIPRIARDAECGDTVAITELCNIVCDSRDTRARNAALRSLAELSHRSAVRALIEEAIVRNDPVISSVAFSYIATIDDAGLKALFSLSLNEGRHIHRDDPDPHLLSAYSLASIRVRKAVCLAAARHSLRWFLVPVLLGTSLDREYPFLIHEEWEYLVTFLIREENWEELWAIVFSAPLGLAVKALHALAGSGWKPGGDEREIWEMVMDTLPDEWRHLLPRDGPVVTIGPGDGLVTRCVFSGDGVFLATGSCDGTGWVWDVRSGALVSSFQTGCGPITSLVFSSDCRFLITGEGTAGYRCRECRTGSPVWEYIGGSRGSRNTCGPILSNDGLSLMIPDSENSITVLSAATGTFLNRINGVTSPVTAFAVIPDSPVVLAGCADGSVRLVNPAGNSAVKIMAGNGYPVRTLGVSPDGETVTVTFDAGRPVLIDKAGNIQRVFPGPSGKSDISSGTPDGARIALVDEGSVNIWCSWTDKSAYRLPLSAKRITACAITSDGKSLAAGFNDGTVRMNSVDRGRTAWEHRGHRKGVTSLLLSPDNTLLFSAGWDRSIRLWNTNNGEPERTLLQGNGGVAGLALIDNGYTLAVGYSAGSIRLYQALNGKPVQTLNRYSPAVRAVSSNPAGTSLAVAGSDNMLWIWNRKDENVTLCEGLRAPPRCLSFLPGDETVISGGWDGKVRLWDSQKGTLLGRLSGHTSIVTSCAANPDGTIFVTGSNDRTVRIWSRRSLRVVRVIRESKTEIGAVAFSPDGCYLAAAGGDGIIRVFTMPDGRPEQDIPGVAGAVRTLAFSGDGHILAAGYDTGILVLIAWTERRIIHTVSAHSGPVTGIGIIEHGRRLVTGGNDGFLRFWSLPFSPNLGDTMPEEVSTAAALEEGSPPGKDRGQWRFLRTLLSARFSSEFEICMDQAVIDPFDIEIPG